MCWLSTHLKWRFYIRVTWTDVITGKKSCSPLCCIAHKKQSEKPISWTNPRQEAPLPPFFLRTTFRNSVITPASCLIEMSTTLRSSLWCSHCSVAKRQQFSCPLGTATLSLKLENVVPGCWICVFSYCGQVFFHCSSIDEQYSYVRVFKKNLVPGTM